MHDFTVDDHWLEVSKLVLKFSLLIFASEEVDTILDCITLSAKL